MPIAAPTVFPSGETVDQRIRSLMEHPLYADPEDSRLRDHVAEEFARAYPEPAEPDPTGRLFRTAPAIRPDDVRPFPPLSTDRAVPLRPQFGEAHQPPVRQMVQRNPEFGEVPPPVAVPVAEPRFGSAPLQSRAGTSPPVPGAEPLPPQRRPPPSNGGLGVGNSVSPRAPEDEGSADGPTGGWSRPKNPVPGETKAEALVYGGKLLGLTQAARALDHYRGATGQPLEMPADWLRAHEEIRQAEGKNRNGLERQIQSDQKLLEQLEKLKEEQSISATLHEKNENIKAEGKSDLHYASGKSNRDSSATFTFTREGGRIVVSGEQEHRWHDTYDWEKGTKFFHGMVTGDEMIELEKQGKAKTFDMTGGWGGAIVGSIPIGPDGRVGEPAIDWTGGKAAAERRNP